MARILLIDDDEVFRIVTRAMMESGGHVVTEAANGLEADKIMRRLVPDLVVTDLLMPDKDGIESILALRAARPGLPIIAISGGGATGGLDMLNVAARFGANFTLAKPFTAAQLSAAVEGVLAPAA